MSDKKEQDVLGPTTYNPYYGNITVALRDRLFTMRSIVSKVDKALTRAGVPAQVRTGFVSDALGANDNAYVHMKDVVSRWVNVA